MRIIIVGVRDPGATGYCLAHAINKYTDHQCVNLRAQHSYINYPTIADMANYDVGLCRKMIYNSDVIMFQSGIKPFFEGLQLDTQKLRDKKKLLMCMGTEWRYGRKYLVEEAEKFLGDYQILLGGAGMFLPSPKGEPCPDTAKYLPPVRSFSEIRRKFGLCNQDQNALKSFDVPKKKVVFCHAPTSEPKKGSVMFYRAITQVMRNEPNMAFSGIRMQPWATALSLISQADVLLDQNPPFPVGYGAISVEASIFKLPIITKIDPRCIAWLKQHTGLDAPFITFSDEDDLMGKIQRLAVDTKLRRIFGNMTYKFCKQLHDEKPVVERFMRILEEMN